MGTFIIHKDNFLSRKLAVIYRDREIEAMKYVFGKGSGNRNASFLLVRV